MGANVAPGSIGAEDEEEVEGEVEEEEETVGIRRAPPFVLVKLGAVEEEEEPGIFSLSPSSAAEDHCTASSAQCVVHTNGAPLSL